MLFQKISGSEKVYGSEGGGGEVSRFSVENFLSDSAEKLNGGTLLCCFRKFLVAKKLMDQRGGGVSRFSVENFLSRSAEKFRRGTLRCIRKFRVAKNFMHQKGRGYQVSSSETFCHTVPKNFVREHLGVSESFVHRKFLCKRWGISLNSVEKSLSHCR